MNRSEPRSLGDPEQTLVNSSYTPVSFEEVPPRSTATPLVFISHKHCDHKIALMLAAFIEERSAGAIKVHLSSSPDFQGPRFGKALNAQLRRALWSTDVLVLLYTSPDHDWSYCMWECGMAAHPQSPDTQIIVFQCGPDVPAPFQDALRVNARSADDIKRFADQLLRDPELFPGLGKAIAPQLKDAYVQNAANELHLNLATVLPPLDDGQAEEWPAWPYLRVELPRSEAERIQGASEAERRKLAREIIVDHATVTRSDARAAQLFGRQGLPAKMKLQELLNAWRSKYPDADAGWFESCWEQIMVCCTRGFPVICSASMREIDGDSRFTPVVARVKRLPFVGTVQFDLYFYNLSDPRALPVTQRMVPLREMFHKRMGEVDPRTLKLRDLVQELSVQKRNRVPILTREGAPLYIVHRSMIEQFIVKRVLCADAVNEPSALTLHDLLADAEMKGMFERSFAVVHCQATLADAKAMMVTQEGCTDVFITDTGKSTETVQGLLTNVEIARSA